MKKSFLKKSVMIAMVLVLSIGALLMITACDNSANDQALVDEAVAALNVPSAAIPSSLTKITPSFKDDEGKYADIIITMSSSNTAVISNEGVITRTKNNEKVTVTYILTLNEATASVPVEYTVGADSELAKEYLNQVMGTITLPATTTGNITIPTINTTTYPGVTLTFTSSNAEVITNAGVVTRPLVTDVDVSVTVSLKRDLTTVTKNFIITVTGRAPSTDAERVQVDLEAIKLPGATISNLTLPTTGAQGSSISWESSRTQSIATNGTVTRDSSDRRVSLTATVTKGTETQTRYIDVYVLRNETIATGAYARASKNNQMYYLSKVNGNVWLTTEGLAFVDPSATVRKIEFALSHSAGDTVAYDVRDYNDVWFQNSISGNGMEYKFSINLTEAYKDLLPGGDWVKFFIKVTEGSGENATVTYLRNAANNNNGCSVGITGGTGATESWAANNADVTISTFIDSAEDTWALKFDWGQIHLRKNG